MVKTKTLDFVNIFWTTSIDLIMIREKYLKLVKSNLIQMVSVERINNITMGYWGKEKWKLDRFIDWI